MARKRKPKAQPTHPNIAEQEERKAAAMKCFPFGFGTATGTNFVVEEIGEVYDDEEDYGSYQNERRDVKTKHVRAKVGS